MRKPAKSTNYSRRARWGYVVAMVGLWLTSTGRLLEGIDEGSTSDIFIGVGGYLIVAALVLYFRQRNQIEEQLRDRIEDITFERDALRQELARKWMRR